MSDCPALCIVKADCLTINVYTYIEYANLKPIIIDRHADISKAVNFNLCARIDFSR